MNEEDMKEDAQIFGIIKKEHMEHAMMIGLTVAIVLLLVSFGFSTYTFYKTKTEKSAEIFSLTGNIANLSEAKEQLVSDKGNLTVEITSLRESVAGLTDENAALSEERVSLTTENDDLTSQLSALQVKYDKSQSDLDKCQSDLDSCQSA